MNGAIIKPFQTFSTDSTPELSDQGQVRTEHEFTSNRSCLPLVRPSDFVGFSPECVQGSYLSLSLRSL